MSDSCKSDICWTFYAELGASAELLRALQKFYTMTLPSADDFCSEQAGYLGLHSNMAKAVSSIVIIRHRIIGNVCLVSGQMLFISKRSLGCQSESSGRAESGHLQAHNGTHRARQLIFSRSPHVPLTSFMGKCVRRGN